VVVFCILQQKIRGLKYEYLLNISENKTRKKAPSLALAGVGKI
jgi:hypothetical protein